jgi:hypothetical protein
MCVDNNSQAHVYIDPTTSPFYALNIDIDEVVSFIELEILCRPIKGLLTSHHERG